MSNALALIQSHALGEFGDLASSAMDLLDNAVAALKVDTTFGPPIYIPNPFKTGGAGGAPGGNVVQGKGFDIGRMLKPKITFEMREGWGSNRSFAPYGDPGTSMWPVVLLAGLGVFLLAGYGGVKLARR